MCRAARASIVLVSRYSEMPFSIPRVLRMRARRAQGIEQDRSEAGGKPFERTCNAFGWVAGAKIKRGFRICNST
nr:MAG TPA: hypothetical protein [Caudoviricetes sp.]